MGDPAATVTTLAGNNQMNDDEQLISDDRTPVSDNRIPVCGMDLNVPLGFIIIMSDDNDGVTEHDDKLVQMIVKSPPIAWSDAK